jgi:hypothetical protein
MGSEITMNSNLFLKKEYSPWLANIKLDAPIAQQAVSQLSAEQKSQQVVGQIQETEKGQQVVGQIDHRNISNIIELKAVGFKPEYALSDINKPIGVSEYRLSESIPDTFKGSLPTIEQIEAVLGGERG